ncbi:winged helix-turn-helix transcriptional regulator [Williamsia deligens]|uniref:Winged helix-turn-helix transcriptional regulator n=1 Tax=Williamsia deligens TaxID=321325 RepID=A0ABW3G6E1_9NOCA|nr:helix-turn-helix domain-containing protein [Williamsia deligens]
MSSGTVASGHDADADGAVLAPTGPLAHRSAWRADACPAAATLGVVGTRSALLIMREALYGTTRFDDFVERVGITDAVASARLKELTAAGLLHKVPYREPGRRTRHEYRPTPAGTDFAPVILALYDWGAKHLTSDGRAPLDFRHVGCEAPVHVDVVCDEGHRVSIDEVHVVRPRR